MVCVWGGGGHSVASGHRSTCNTPSSQKGAKSLRELRVVRKAPGFDRALDGQEGAKQPRGHRVTTKTPKSEDGADQSGAPSSREDSDQESADWLK